MKILPIEGADGRQYFTYGIGCKFQFTDREGALHSYEIVDAFLAGDVQYFTVRSSDHIEKTLTGNRVHYLIEKCGYNVNDEGELREFPLTKDDVFEYNAAMDQIEKSRLNTIRKALKESKFKDLRLKSAALRDDFCAGRISAAEWGLQDRENDQAIEDELKKFNLTSDDLKARPKCPVCEGIGIVGGVSGTRICDCMIKRSEEVKAVAASARARRKVII